MRSVFEGQVIEAPDIDYDMLQIRSERTICMRRARFFVVPTFEDTGREHLLVLSYYKHEACSRTREGILRFRELSCFPTVTSTLVLSETFAVKKPLSFREVIREGQKYLMVTPNVEEEHDILIEEGTLVRSGPEYKVFGSGRYIFRGRSILYMFGNSAKCREPGFI